MPPEFKKKEKLIIDSTNCTPTWMVTMGDAMSLLLCFFVMMLNFGSLHSDELINVFGVLSGGNEIMPVQSTGLERPRSKSAEEDEFAPVVLRNTDVPRHLKDLKRKLAAEGYTHNVTIDELKNGIRFRIDEAVLFAADATISPRGQDVLLDIVNLLQGTGNEIRLSACGSPDPNGTDTAYAKSLCVADFLADQGHLPRRRFGIGARFGDDRAVFEIQLMEKAGTKQLQFADLWKREEWDR
jgi:hypothetical protein